HPIFNGFNLGVVTDSGAGFRPAPPLAAVRRRPEARKRGQKHVAFQCDTGSTRAAGVSGACSMFHVEHNKNISRRAKCVSASPFSLSLSLAGGFLPENLKYINPQGARQIRVPARAVDFG